VAGKLTASKLRENIYSMLDEVLDTGIPLEVVRRGKTSRIVSGERPSKLARLKKRDCIAGDPEQIRKIDWLRPWRPFT
jgi:hypothetical protein